MLLDGKGDEMSNWQTNNGCCVGQTKDQNAYVNCRKQGRQKVGRE
jgi:hypothetical protein